MIVEDKGDIILSCPFTDPLLLLGICGQIISTWIANVTLKGHFVYLSKSVYESWRKLKQLYNVFCKSRRDLSSLRKEPL